jgi:hypothetical protein
MKKKLLLLVAIMISGILPVSSFASDPGALDAALGIKTKGARDSTEVRKFEMTKSMLEQKNFVLEADYLGNKYGDRVPVSSTLNFISVDSTNSVLQIGRNTGMGYNGVGGVTAEGNITRYQVQTDKKHNSFYVSFSVTTAIGNYDINMSVGSDGYASAVLTGIGSGQLVYTGYLVPLEDSSVYKGYNTY